MLDTSYFQMKSIHWALFFIASTLHGSSFQAQIALTMGLSEFLFGVLFALIVGSVLAVFAWCVIGNRFSGPSGLTTLALLLYMAVGAAGLIDVAAQNALGQTAIQAAGLM